MTGLKKARPRWRPRHWNQSRLKDRLEEQRAYKLNSRPREIDVRIIDKKCKDDERMDNAIAYLFEKHNICDSGYQYIGE